MRLKSNLSFPCYKYQAAFMLVFAYLFNIILLLISQQSKLIEPLPTWDSRNRRWWNACTTCSLHDMTQLLVEDSTLIRWKVIQLISCHFIERPSLRLTLVLVTNIEYLSTQKQIFVSSRLTASLEALINVRFSFDHPFIIRFLGLNSCFE